MSSYIVSKACGQVYKIIDTNLKNDYIEVGMAEYSTFILPGELTLKKLVLVFCILFICCSKQHSDYLKHDTNQPQNKIMINFDIPIIIDSTQYIFIPTGLHEYTSEDEGFLSSSSHKRSPGNIGNIYEGEFDKFDTFSLLKVELFNPKIGVEFIDKNITNRIKQLFSAN